MPSDSLSTRAVASRSCLLALGWIGITAALFGVGQFVVHSHAITDFDRNVTNWVVNHRTPALNATMRTITWIGSWVAVAVTGGVVLVLTLAKRLTIAHLLMLAVAWAGEYAMVNVIKYAVGRPRPPKDLWLVTAHGSSFPSGHAANATLVCIAASLVAFLLSLRFAVRAADGHRCRPRDRGSRVLARGAGRPLDHRCNYRNPGDDGVAGSHGQGVGHHRAAHRSRITTD